MSDISLPEARRWRAAHKVILRHEAWLYHADRLRAGAPYGPIFRDSIMAGEAITGAAYDRALRVRMESIETMAAVFGTVDVVLVPTCPTVAPAIEEGRRALAYTRYTTLAAFAGLPAISIPVGTGHLGLPIGGQLLAAAGAEGTLVGAAALLERLIGADRDRPA
jgi:aspartyl-tRNA(Asn)/glutamyl-tRNA(Gln) amidotransferase subunit A